jgi:hypothetical protein
MERLYLRHYKSAGYYAKVPVESWGFKLQTRTGQRPRYAILETANGIARTNVITVDPRVKSAVFLSEHMRGLRLSAL